MALDFCLLVACTAYVAQVNNVAGSPVGAKKSQPLSDRLAESTLWTNPDRKAELLQVLEHAKKLRSQKLAPVLVGHISYSPYAYGQATMFMRPEMQYPVYGCLKEAGMLAADVLVKRLRGIGYQEDALQRNLLAACLKDIYDEAGFEEGWARNRLEMELRTASLEETLRLRRTLQECFPAHPPLQ